MLKNTIFYEGQSIQMSLLYEHKTEGYNKNSLNFPYECEVFNLSLHHII
jgi:hypothetical protein